MNVPKNINYECMLKINRLKKEIKSFDIEREYYYQIINIDDNIDTFYFVIRGIDNSCYEGGYYMGKIILPPEYPTKGPEFYMLTPSGRFTINQKICLSNSSFHPENAFQSSTWNISKMIVGMCSIFENDKESGISHLRDTPESRKVYAKNSIQYNLDKYGVIFKKFDNYFKLDGIMRTNTQDIKDYVSSLHNERKKRIEEKRNIKKNKLASKRLAKNDITLETVVEAKNDITLESNDETKKEKKKKSDKDETKKEKKKKSDKKEKKKKSDKD